MDKPDPALFTTGMVPIHPDSRLPKTEWPGVLRGHYTRLPVEAVRASKLR